MRFGKSTAHLPPPSPSYNKEYATNLNISIPCAEKSGRTYNMQELQKALINKKRYGFEMLSYIIGPQLKTYYWHTQQSPTF